MEDEERATAPAPDEPIEAPVAAPVDDTVVSNVAEVENSAMAPATGDPAPVAVSDDPAPVEVAPPPVPVEAGPPPVPVEAAAPVSGTRPAAPRRAPARPDVKGRGGTAGIFAGVAVIAPVLIRELALGTQPFVLLPVTMIALAVALSGFRVAQAGRDGKLGRIGLIVAVLGALILTLMFAVMAYQDLVRNTRLQSGSWLIKFGFFALLGGILIFGAATLVAGVITRGPTLLMMVSLVVGVLLDAIGAFPRLRFRWGPDVVLGQGMHYGLKIFGLSLIWLGYSILKDTKAKAAAVVREA